MYTQRERDNIYMGEEGGRRKMHSKRFVLRSWLTQLHRLALLKSVVSATRQETQTDVNAEVLVPRYVARKSTLETQARFLIQS